MHTRDARARGETDERLYLLAMLGGSRRLLGARAGGAGLDRGSDPGLQTCARCRVEEVRRHFAEDELVKLTLLVTTINAWNRIAISFRIEIRRIAAGAMYGTATMRTG